MCLLGNLKNTVITTKPIKITVISLPNNKSMDTRFTVLKTLICKLCCAALN